MQPPGFLQGGGGGGGPLGLLHFGGGGGGTAHGGGLGSGGGNNVNAIASGAFQSPAAGLPGLGQGQGQGQVPGGPHAHSNSNPAKDGAAGHGQLLGPPGAVLFTSNPGGGR